MGRAGGWIRAARRGVEGGRKRLRAGLGEGVLMGREWVDGMSEEGRERRLYEVWNIGCFALHWRRIRIDMGMDRGVWRFRSRHGTYLVSG